LECEVEYYVDIQVGKKGKITIMGSRSKHRDWYRSARRTGYFPLTFNFVFIKDDKYIQCSYCGMFIYCKDITKDHVYPKSKGGEMKTPACMNCNVVKEDMLPIDWAIFASKHGIDIATIPIGYLENG
jgi:hypothetical protein